MEGRPIRIKVNGQNLEKVKQFCYQGSLVTEDGRSCREVRRRIAGKEAFNKKKDLMNAEISQPSFEKTFGESIRLECRVIWE